MAGGLGGLGGFGSVLGALGQSLLTSPRENPFQGLPAALQASAKDREHQAALNAMSTVAEKLGVPKELAASPEAMKLFIDHINATKFDQLRRQAAQISLTPPDEGGTTSQPALSVPGVQSSSSGIPTTFNVAGGLGGGGGLGGPVASAPLNPGLQAAVTRGKGSAPSARNLPSAETAQAIAASAQRLGVNPVDLATVISYESGGTFSPSKYGGAGGRYLGLIQFGPTEQKQFGAHPGQTVEEQLQAAERYLTARGFKPGMGILDLYSTINAGRPGRYNASDAGNGGAPGTVADKVKYQMGAHRARALAMFNALGGQGAQTAAAGAPLPPARPAQLASADPNMPLPSTAMQRVIDEAATRGIGQGGPDTGQAGAGIGQSGAPLNQVAAGGRRLTVPIPGAIPAPLPGVPLPGANGLVPPRPPYTGSAPATPAAQIPATTTPPAVTPPAGEGTNKTKAWAKNLFQYGMNQLALSNGDPVLMKQAEIILQRAAKYGDPSDMARRVGEAGLAGTPAGRGLIAGFPSHTIEKLLEQQIPGYESPGTLEQKKFTSAEDERKWQHSRLETEFGATEEERRFRRKLDSQKFANEIGHQTLQLGEQRASRKQQRDIATESHAIQLTPPAQILGRALTTDRSAPETRAGLDAQQQQVAAEAQAREAARLTPEAILGRELNRPDLAAATRAGLEAQTAAKAATAGAETTAKSQATAQSTLPTAEAATSSAIEAIRELRNHPGRKWATGGTAIFSPWDIARPGGPTADFIALVKTLKGQLFKNAYETLKGEKGITDVEGEKATQAILNLDRTQSEGQFLKNLETAEGILQKGVDTVRARAGVRQQTPTMSSGDIAQSLANARAAIKAGKPRDAVMEHLRANGIDPRGL